MTTTVINLKGRIRDYGPTLGAAPDGLVYVGRRLTMGGWNLPEHPLHNPYTLREYGTPESAVAAYIRRLLDNPELLDQAAVLRGKVLACWCTPAICHAHAIAIYADNPSPDRLASYAADLDWAAGLVETALFARLEGGS